jgi:ABC-type nitrate/sulfonate/bicarbonate transport system ATPase subunit
LLNCLTGLDNQFEGGIEINGITQNNFLKEDRMALVTQKYGNYPWMTVEENIKLGLGKKKNVGKVNDIIDKIELKGFENYFLNQLSGGMQQRVALGRAILQNSDILVMDEPFGALDYMTRSNLQKMLKEINNRYRKTIVFVTHDIEEAIYLSDRIFILSKMPTVIAKEIVLPPMISQVNTSEIKYKEVFIKIRSEIESVLASL